MNIIHYSLGFPPYRSGGMTKFCTDLMIKQSEEGHNVALMWPGRISLIDKRVKILKGIEMFGIKSFEIKNPLPISLNGGISDIPLYTGKCKNSEAYEKFLEGYKPDVLHFHTLMGIHREFLEIAKKRGIRLVYTTHDYFGICPKLTMFRNGAVCQNVKNCTNCPQCNERALSKKKIFILQSPVYRKFKDLFWVKKFREQFREKFFKENDDNKKRNNIEKVLEYKTLRQYYVDMFEMMSKIHFNSSLAKDVFLKYVPQMEQKGEVVLISHNDIRDQRKVTNPGEKIRLGFMSMKLESKGYLLLLDALEELWEEGERWFELHLFGRSINHLPFVVEHDRYQYGELEKSYRNIDVMIMPSIWYETFGFVVLEALSFGIPVIVTENVGSKEIIEEGKNGNVIPVKKEDLKRVIRSLENGNKIREYNKNILTQNKFGTLEYLEKIEEMYR